jgi:hypothetical protein
MYIGNIDHKIEEALTSLDVLSYDLHNIIELIRKGSSKEEKVTTIAISKELHEIMDSLDNSLDKLATIQKELKSLETTNA